MRDNVRFHKKKCVVKKRLKQVFPTLSAIICFKTVLSRFQSSKSFFIAKNESFMLQYCLCGWFLRAKVASNKFKSGAGIQKRIHLQDWRRRDFEAKRKRSSVAKRGFKRPHRKSSGQKQPINKNTA